MATTKTLREAESPAEFQAALDKKREVRMNRIDRMPPDLRECVHDYGFTVVTACMDLGIKKGSQVRHLVETVLNELSPTRGTFSNQGVKAKRDDNEQNS